MTTDAQANEVEAAKAEFDEAHDYFLRRHDDYDECVHYEIEQDFALKATAYINLLEAALTASEAARERLAGAVEAYAAKEQDAEYDTLSIQETAGYQLAMRRVLHQFSIAQQQEEAKP